MSAPADSGSGGRWQAEARPRLASKVRFQWNAARNQALLLYPEGALVLNPTAQAVLELCDGQRTLTEIVHVLAGRFDGSSEKTAAEPVALSTDPGTSAAEPEDVSGEPDVPTAERRVPSAQTRLEEVTPPAAGEQVPAERERVIARDVKAFLERLDQRGWLVDAAG